VIDLETTLLQQSLNIAQRKRIAKIPPDRTKYEIRFGLSPFEDRGSGYHSAILSHHQPATRKLQHIHKNLAENITPDPSINVNLW
jgi:hypothetical protein